MRHGSQPPPPWPAASCRCLGVQRAARLEEAGGCLQWRGHVGLVMGLLKMATISQNILQQQHATARCRLGAASLCVHTEHTTPYQQRTCLRCSTGAVDSAHHLLIECDHLDLQVSRQTQHHDVQGAQVSVHAFMALAYDATKVESLTSYIHEAIHSAQG